MEQTGPETQTEQQPPLRERCQPSLHADDGDPEGCFLSPGDVSISSSPFHAREPHLCPAVPPGTVAECQWSGGAASPHICHGDGLGTVTVPHLSRSCHQLDRHLRLLAGTPVLPSPALPAGREAGLLSGVGRFLAQVKCPFTNEHFNFPRALKFHPINQNQLIGLFLLR